MIRKYFICLFFCLVSLNISAKKLWSPVKTIITSEMKPKVYKYPQCTEVLPEKIAFEEKCNESQSINCSKNPYNNYADCLEQGKKCLKDNDKLNLDTALLQKVMGYDIEGVKDCLFYSGTDIFKRPTQKHLDAIERNKSKINKVAKIIGVPAESIACVIGADATVTRMLWPDQSSLEHYLIHSDTAEHAIGYLKSHNVSIPSSMMKTMSGKMSEDQIIALTAVILKEGDLAYAKYGHDISKRSDVLATLYNIGAFKKTYTAGPKNQNGEETYYVKHISRAKGRGASYKPSPNFFGLYCKRFEKVYKEILAL